jgi:protein-disulfide isomerase
MQERTVTSSLGLGLAGIGLGALLASVVHRAESRRVEQLATRVDSLAVTLTAVVTAVQSGGKAAAPDSLTVSTIGAATQGRADAPVTIVEFTDYQCPFCGRHATTTYPALRKDYIETGKVRYVVRDLPLPMHPAAIPAAIAARCAGAQSPELYWQFHDALFRAQAHLAGSVIDRIASTMPLDRKTFTTCRKSSDAKARLDADVAEATKLGLDATPAFIIGRAGEDGTMRGVVIRGAYPIDQFESAIAAASPAVLR